MMVIMMQNRLSPVQFREKKKKKDLHQSKRRNKALFWSLLNALQALPYELHRHTHTHMHAYRLFASSGEYVGIHRHPSVSMQTHASLAI